MSSQKVHFQGNTFKNFNSLLLVNSKTNRFQTLSLVREENVVQKHSKTFYKT